jgi:hypothetical protein
MWDLIVKGGLAVADGLQQRSAASNAAQELDEGAEQAGNTFQEYINQFAPWLLDAAAQGGKSVADAGEFAAGEVEAAADRGVGRMDDSNALLKQLYEQYMAELSPYQQAGVDALAKAQGAADEKFVFSEDDPSYQWRLQEGQKALERSAAARGVLASGGTLKALTRYAQGAASTEYGAAFDRFQRDRDSRYKMLSDLVGVGERSNALSLTANNNYGQGFSRNSGYASDIDLTGRLNAGRFRTDTTKYASDLNFDATDKFVNHQLDGGRYRADRRLDQANARASGHMGRANAWSSMASNGSEIFNDWWVDGGSGGASVPPVTTRDRIGSRTNR